MISQVGKSGKVSVPATDKPDNKDDDSAVIVRDEGVLEDGTPYWVYIAVTPSRYKDFVRLTSGRMPIHFSEFGSILRFGFEREAPLAVRNEMKEKYGFDDNYLAVREANRMAEIIAMLKKEQPKGG